MGFFDFFKRNKYSSGTMIAIATEWTEYFIASAPKIESDYNRDEVYMFCCWILFDYGMGNGYINTSSNRDEFYGSILQSVRNVENSSHAEFGQFMYRVEQYKKDVNGLLLCDYPNTPVFFAERLFSLFTGAISREFREDDEYDDKEIKELSEFSDFIGDFWNKVIIELRNKFPKR